MAIVNKQKADFSYIIIYLFEWLTGIIFFIISGNDNRKKLHSIQAIILGIIATVLVFLPIPFIGILTLLIWLYGLYIGYMASTGVDVAIPWVTNFAKTYAK
jgi:uncharacterized membrane protein